MFTIQQKSSGRFMDAHEIEEKDFALVTRPAQNNDTQRWLIKSVKRPLHIGLGEVGRR